MKPAPRATMMRHNLLKVLCAVLLCYGVPTLLFACVLRRTAPSVWHSQAEYWVLWGWEYWFCMVGVLALGFLASIGTLHWLGWHSASLTRLVISSVIALILTAALPTMRLMLTSLPMGVVVLLPRIGVPLLLTIGLWVLAGHYKLGLAILLIVFGIASDVLSRLALDTLGVDRGNDQVVYAVMASSACAVVTSLWLSNDLVFTAS